MYLIIRKILPIMLLSVQDNVLSSRYTVGIARGNDLSSLKRPVMLAGRTDMKGVCMKAAIFHQFGEVPRYEEVPAPTLEQEEKRS